MVKKGLGPEAKKVYVKPEITKNEPLVDITFATPPTPAGPATGPATMTGTGGTAGTATSPFITTAPPKISPGGGIGGVTTMGGGDDLGDDGLGTATLTGTGTLIPGTGGAPGTVL